MISTARPDAPSRVSLTFRYKSGANVDTRQLCASDQNRQLLKVSRYKSGTRFRHVCHVYLSKARSRPVLSLEGIVGIRPLKLPLLNISDSTQCQGMIACNPDASNMNNLTGSTMR